MIFVLELQATPHAWFAYDEADLLGKVAARAPEALAEMRARFSDAELAEQGLPEGPARDAFMSAAALRAWAPHRLFWTESEALAAFERTGDADWQGPGWRARWALRDQLVALEVLADDL
jgi:hypothetical protein